MDEMAPATHTPGLPRSQSHLQRREETAGHSGTAAGPAFNHASGPVPGDDEAGKANITSLKSTSTGEEDENQDFRVPHAIYGEPPGIDHTGISSLIVVCCHAIYQPHPASPSFPLHSPQEEQNWHLSSFQRSDPDSNKPGEHETFLLHIRRALALLYASPETVLIFSGGRTKRPLTELSEAESYYNAALADATTQGPEQVSRLEAMRSRERILLEESATDSLQNLLFSIQLFQNKVSYAPEHVRIITHAFKTHRFLKLHAAAIAWPMEKIQVEGINPPFSAQELIGVEKGEAIACTEWEKDPLCKGGALRAKRRARGWEEEKDLADEAHGDFAWKWAQHSNETSQTEHDA